MARIYDDDRGIKEQLEKLKGQPLKVKVEYFFQYFGLATAIILGVIIAIVAITITVIQNKRPRVIQGESYSLYINMDKNEEFKEELCEKLGMNPDETLIDLNYTVSTDSDAEYAYSVQMKIAARLAASDLDFIIGVESLMISYAKGETIEETYFYDLRELLPEETFNELDRLGRICWVTANDGTSYPAYINIKDTAFYKRFEMISKQAFVAFPCNAPHTDACVLLCSYFLDPLTAE